MSARRWPRPAASAPVALANDPTVERQHIDDFEIIRAPRMANEQIGRDALRTTRRSVPPISRMLAGKDPWLDKRGAAGLERFQLASEKANLGRLKSCLSFSPGGASFEAVSDLQLAALQRFAAAERAIAQVDPVALAFLSALLDVSRSETLGQLARRTLHGGLVEARDRIRLAAELAARHFHRA